MKDRAIKISWETKDGKDGSSIWIFSDDLEKKIPLIVKWIKDALKTIK